MTHNEVAPVLVGVDGSAQALRAVAWAAHEASLHHRPLKVVHAFVWPVLHVPVEPSAYGPAEGGLRNVAERYVADALEHARAYAPSIDVSGAVITGTAVPVLIGASHEAELLVVGNRGLGGFSGLLIGSTGVTAAAYASCPVVVVREPSGRKGRSAGRIVVGVDGSPPSDRAVAFAFEEADRRGVGITALHAWRMPEPLAGDDLLPFDYDVEDVLREEGRVLAECLVGRREKYPDVDLRLEVMNARPARALVAESDGAELVVVGSRGRGGFRGLLLGSVSQAVLHHADCPVAIVRH